MVRKSISNINHSLPQLISILFSIAYYPNHLRYKIKNTFTGRVPLEREILSKTDSINKIITGSSLLRFGDGEIRLIANEDLAFQNANPMLVSSLKDTLCANQDGLVICLPNIFSKRKWKHNKNNFFWEHHLERYYSIYSTLTHITQKYGDSHIFRATIDALKDDDISDYTSYYSAIKSIWNDKSIIVIEGKYSRNGVGNDLFDGAKKVERILCPPIHTYSCYDNLLNYCLTLSKTKLILLSIGPTSKVLGYELWKMGYRVIDIGHIDSDYESYLSNSNKVICSNFKHSAEMNDDRLNNINYSNKKYESEILMIFS